MTQKDHISAESLSSVTVGGVSGRSEGSKEIQTWERLGSCECPEAPGPLPTAHPPKSTPHHASPASRDGIEKTDSGTQQSKIVGVLLPLLEEAKFENRILSLFFKRKQEIYIKTTSTNISQII